MATTTAVELEVISQDGAHVSTPITLSNESPGRSIGDGESTPEILTEERAWIVITQLAGINLCTSFSNGLVTVGLPAIATALELEHNLLVWPSAAFALTSGSLLLLAGSFADIVGPRFINLTGCFFVALFTILSGVATSGMQLIAFRALLGVANALTFPSSISLISRSCAVGKPRNIGFACLGLAMPLGFSFGLVLGGVLITTLGWRVGFYIGGSAGCLFFIVGIWALPPDIRPESTTPIWNRLAKEIDWVGVVLASTCLALFSYVLATLSANIGNIKRATNIALLILSLLLGLAFIPWMHHQEKAGKPTLIPNSIWRKRAFTTICLMVLLSTAVMNCMELFSSLFFQEVQGLSALQASLRILPNMLLGIATNFATGYFINQVPAIYAVLISSGLCAGAPLLMAVIDPKWTYWRDAFFAQLLAPLSADILFTVGILIVSDVFPENTQALAGAVFNTLAQLGTSIGLTTMSVISVNISNESRYRNKTSPAALMEGYRASFWALFAWMVTACLIGGYGLRNLGKIGQKRD